MENAQVAAKNRILLYGVTGAGKSTLAARLSARTGIPWHHVDDLTWQPGWIPTPLDEQRRRVAAICAGDQWILDTAYSAWLDLVLPRVELVVALDLPRALTLARLLRRTAARIVDGKPVCNGNRETLRNALSRDSIIAWHFRTFSSKRRQMRAWEADRDGPDVIRLTSPRAVEEFLARTP